jgi:hypothetical protein
VEHLAVNQSLDTGSVFDAHLDSGGPVGFDGESALEGGDGADLDGDGLPG